MRAGRSWRLRTLLGWVDVPWGTRLLVARKQVLGLLIDQVNGSNVYETLDAAILEVKRAAHKLSRYHPEAEILPLNQWSEIKELGILCAHARGKKADMS